MAWKHWVAAGVLLLVPGSVAVFLAAFAGGIIYECGPPDGSCESRIVNLPALGAGIVLIVAGVILAAIGFRELRGRARAHLGP